MFIYKTYANWFHFIFPNIIYTPIHFAHRIKSFTHAFNLIIYSKATFEIKPYYAQYNLKLN